RLFQLYMLLWFLSRYFLRYRLTLKPNNDLANRLLMRLPIQNRETQITNRRDMAQRATSGGPSMLGCSQSKGGMNTSKLGKSYSRDVIGCMSLSRGNGSC
ncbi:hypothetical protein FRC07_009878, partial [Ceratobasidium sp. 392]